MNQPMNPSSETFSDQRAAQLAEEASAWDASSVVSATLDDIPVVDVSGYFSEGDPGALPSLGERIREISEKIGFYYLVGHGIDQPAFDAIFAAARQFLTLPDEVKGRIRIDAPEAAATGIGWLPIRERRLPERAKGNLNEAVLFKQDRALRLADNPWLPEAEIPEIGRAHV